MNNISDFNFFVPAEVFEKSTKHKDGTTTTDMYIQGVASTNDKDLENETLEPSGYELDHFLKSGTINYEHLAKKSPLFICGEPTEAYIKDNKMHMKAKLWGNSKVAKDIYSKMKELEESGSTRRAGFSIEGKSLERDPNNPKRITKALITACAITFSPVNTNTLASICKGIQKEDYVEPTYDQDSDEKPFIMEFDYKGKKMRVGKDYKVFEVLTKSMDVAAVKPLTPESLDKKPKNIGLPDIKKAIDNILKHKSLFDGDSDFKNKVIKLVKNSL